MNIPRYILPVSIAAAFHAALFWVFPAGPVPSITTLIEVPLPPMPKQPDEPMTPPEEKLEPVDAVQPLAGDPAPPDMPDLLVNPKPDTLTIPLEARPSHPTTSTSIIPTKFGPGETDGKPTDWSAGPIFSADHLDRVPNARTQLPPEYPFDLKRTGVEGTVVVEFDVDRTGQVRHAQVVSSTHREFEEPTLRAVMKWRFEPGRRNGRTVPFRMQVPVDFHLD